MLPDFLLLMVPIKKKIMIFPSWSKRQKNKKQDEAKFSKLSLLLFRRGNYSMLIKPLRNNLKWECYKFLPYVSLIRGITEPTKSLDWTCGIGGEMKFVRQLYIFTAAKKVKVFSWERVLVSRRSPGKGSGSLSKVLWRVISQKAFRSYL